MVDDEGDEEDEAAGDAWLGKCMSTGTKLFPSLMTIGLNHTSIFSPSIYGYSYRNFCSDMHSVNAWRFFTAFSSNLPPSPIAVSSTIRTVPAANCSSPAESEEESAEEVEEGQKGVEWRRGRVRGRSTRAGTSWRSVLERCGTDPMRFSESVPSGGRAVGRTEGEARRAKRMYSADISSTDKAIER